MKAKKKVETVSPELPRLPETENLEAIADQQVELQEVETMDGAQKDVAQADGSELPRQTKQTKNLENQEATGEDGESADQEAEHQEEASKDCA